MQIQQFYLFVTCVLHEKTVYINLGCTEAYKKAEENSRESHYSIIKISLKNIVVIQIVKGERRKHGIQFSSKLSKNLKATHSLEVDFIQGAVLKKATG